MLELRIDGWRKGLRFSSAHITPEHKKCGRLHGHTYAIHLRMRGAQDEWGIVLDFGIITDTLKQIGDEIDHLVLVPTESNHYSDLKVTKADVRLRVTDPYTGEPKEFSFPRQDCALLPIPSTTAEDLAKYVYREFLRRTKFTTKTAFVEVGVHSRTGETRVRTRASSPSRSSSCKKAISPKPPSCGWCGWRPCRRALTAR